MKAEVALCGTRKPGPRRPARPSPDAWQTQRRAWGSAIAGLQHSHQAPPPAPPAARRLPSQPAARMAVCPASMLAAPLMMVFMLVVRRCRPKLPVGPDTGGLDCGNGGRADERARLRARQAHPARWMRPLHALHTLLPSQPCDQEGAEHGRAPRTCAAERACKAARAGAGGRGGAVAHQLQPRAGGCPHIAVSARPQRMPHASRAGEGGRRRGWRPAAWHSARGASSGPPRAPPAFCDHQAPHLCSCSTRPAAAPSTPPLPRPASSQLAPPCRPAPLWAASSVAAAS